MRSPTYDLTISTARADALFASPLQRSDEPTPAQVHQAIAAAVARTSGVVRAEPACLPGARQARLSCAA